MNKLQGIFVYLMLNKIYIVTKNLLINEKMYHNFMQTIITLHELGESIQLKDIRW